MGWQCARLGCSQKIGEDRPGVPKAVAIGPRPVLPGVTPEGVTPNDDHGYPLKRWAIATRLNQHAAIVSLAELAQGKSRGSK